MVGTGESYRTVYHLHYYNYHEAAGLAYADFHRNMGPFREPGMYQFMLLVALLFIIFTKNVVYTRFKTVVLLIALLTTFSTTGIICAVLLILAFLSSRESKRNAQKINLKIILTYVVGIIAIFSVVFFDKLFNKLIVQNASVLDRSITTKNDIDLWLHNPILGIGPETFFNTGIGSNNGITSTMALFGIIYILIVFIALGSFINNITGVKEHRIPLTNVMVFVIFIIQLSTQAILFIPIFQILLYSSFILRRENRKEYV
jgi:hypothetical protein